MRVISDSPARLQQWPRLLVVGTFLRDFELGRYAGGNLAAEIRRCGQKVITTSACRSKPLRLADMLQTTFRRRNEYDVGHITVFSDRAFIYAECIATLLAALRKPCTLGLHGGNLPIFAGRHPVRMRRLLRRARSVICPSRYLFEQLESFGKELHLIPNALDIARYRCREKAARGNRLLWLRAFHHIYNPQMAIAAFGQLSEFDPGVSMTMVGPDKGDGSLQATKRRVEEMGLRNRITFLGAIPKEDVPDVIARHDIFLNTAHVDNTPVSIIEAMASGLPVVSTNVGGIPYLVEHGKTALLVQTANSAEMAEAIKRLLSEPDVARTLAENGRKLAESFDWKTVLPQWQRLFNRIAFV